MDAQGAAYVTGWTNSPDFPVTTGAFHEQLPPYSSGFAAKLDPTGGISYATFLGTDRGNGIAVDGKGNAYIAGGEAWYVGSPGNGFVLKLNPTGTGAIYSTPFAAAQAAAIAIDSQGNAHITGRTSDGLPVYHAFQPSFYPRGISYTTASGTSTYGYTTCTDAFVAALDASGSGLLYSTYLNGYQQVAGRAIAVDGQGNTYAGGFGTLTLAKTNPLSNGGGAFVVKLRQAGAPPFFTRQSITNAANFASGLAEPGGLASVFTAGLQGIPGTLKAPGYPLPNEIAGVRVKIGGIAAPLLSISDLGGGGQQINLQVPFEANVSALDVEISQNGLTSWVPDVDTKSTAPGLFTLDGTYGVVQHGADYSLVTSEAPAHPDEIVVLYGTGLGPVTPAVASGAPAPFAVLPTVRTPTVKIGGQVATVEFSGLVPGLIGVYQLNARVPSNAAAGDQDIVVSFPSYQVCCTGAGGSLRNYTIVVDSKPVKLPIR